MKPSIEATVERYPPTNGTVGRSLSEPSLVLKRLGVTGASDPPVSWGHS